jgi:formylglycine-generating enzyme required for sulfatase activity
MNSANAKANGRTMIRIFVVFVFFLATVPVSAQPAPLTGIPGGTFRMGDSAGDSNETERQVTVAPFRMLAREVTNREFTEFVRATGHVTDPERSGEGYVWTDRWRAVTGADWRSNAPAQSGPLPARRANYGADGCCAADDTDGFRKTAPVGSFPAGVSPYGLRAAYKHGNPSDIGLDMVGFRCAADESGRIRR